MQISSGTAFSIISNRGNILINITVIICHHKGDLLYEAVETLLESRHVKFDIIIATSLYLDNPIIDKFWTKHPEVRFIQIDGGPATKRNYASRYAQGELIAFFDDDVQVDRYALFEQARIFEDESIGMTFGKLKNYEFRDRFDEAGSYLTWSGFLWARAESGCIDQGQYEMLEPVLAGKSASCMIRKKLMKQLGGFDESFEILGEETDLAWRVWLSGSKVLYVPTSVTWHKFNTKYKPIDFYTHERIYFNGCRNYITMLLKNLGKEHFWILIPHTLVWFWAAFGMMLVGKWKAGWNIFRGLYYVALHSKDILQKRRYIQQSRVIQDNKLFSKILRAPSWKYYLHRFMRYLQVGLHG